MQSDLVLLFFLVETLNTGFVARLVKRLVGDMTKFAFSRRSVANQSPTKISRGTSFVHVQNTTRDIQNTASLPRFQLFIAAKGSQCDCNVCVKQGFNRDHANISHSLLYFEVYVRIH